MAKAELKLTSLGFWRGYSSAIRAGIYSELVAVAPIFQAMMNERLVRKSYTVKNAQTNILYIHKSAVAMRKTFRYLGILI